MSFQKVKNAERRAENEDFPREPRDTLDDDRRAAARILLIGVIGQRNSDPRNHLRAVRDRIDGRERKREEAVSLPVRLELREERGWNWSRLTSDNNARKSQTHIRL